MINTIKFEIILHSVSIEMHKTWTILNWTMDYMQSIVCHIESFQVFSSFLSLDFCFLNLFCIIRKTLKGRKQTKMEGGQSSTYLRQTRASSSPQVHVAKRYRDETKRKWIFRPAAEEGHCDLAEVFIFVSFHLYMS